MRTKMEVNNEYMTILSDGSMRLPATETTEGAIKREYETSDGKTGTKWETVYRDLSGLITNVDFYDGEYGTLLQLTVEDGEEKTVLSVSTSSNFGEDLMKKLPNIDMKKPVKIVPFAFEDDNGKKKKGVTVYQNDVKLENFYYDKNSKTNMYGYPNIEMKKGKKISSDEWKIYFTQCRVFLIEDLKKRFKKSENIDELVEILEEGKTF